MTSSLPASQAMPTFQLIDSPVSGIITSSGGAICVTLAVSIAP
ncbi:hypothetical protein [Enterobacter asburiae]|nr:hypothetical protein [Enterobacter asburiae]